MGKVDPKKFDYYWLKFPKKETYLIMRCAGCKGYTHSWEIKLFYKNFLKGHKSVINYCTLHCDTNTKHTIVGKLHMVPVKCPR